jgi:uncharacterized delta-60 repeat protein
MGPRRTPLLPLALGVALALPFAAAGPAFATAGDLDVTFSTDGIATADFGSYDAAMGVVVLGNGRIVVTGYTYDGEIALVRYLPDGSKDQGFGSHGKITTLVGNGSISNSSGASAVQDDNKVVVVGGRNLQTSTSSDFVVLRYTKRGALDDTFGGDGKVVTHFGDNEAAYDVAIQPDGKIVAAGHQLTDGGNDQNVAVARYRPDGDLDPKFDDDGKRIVDFGAYDALEAVALQADGKIVLVGSTWQQGSNGSDILVARIRPRGALDTTFGGGDGYVTLDLGGTEDARDVAIQPDGGIVVAGIAGRGITVIRYRPDGTLDDTLGVNGVVFVPIADVEEGPEAVALQSDGKIVIGGTLSETELFLLRLLGDGTRDITVGTNGLARTDLGDAIEHGYAMAIQPDGAILLVGDRGTGNDNDFVTCRFLGA